MLEFKKSTDAVIPIRLEDSGINVTGKVAADLTVKIANKDSADWEPLTAAMHYTLNELSEGDYSLTILADVNDTIGALRLKVSGTGFDTMQYVVNIALYLQSDQASLAVASIAGDLSGKVLGGGVSTITGTGARVVDASGNNVAPASDVTTLINRLGAWTGSGLNTVLGAFRALMAKAAALTPSDISTGTTYDNTTDALEAIKDTAYAGGPVASVTGDLGGKILGAGVSAISGVGARVYDDAGNAVASASSIAALNNLSSGQAQSAAAAALAAYNTTGVAKEASVLGIQNNTRFVTAIPTTMLTPPSSYTVYELLAYFYDTDGTLEDPDSDELALQVLTSGGVDKTGNLYKDYAVTTQCDVSGSFVGHRKLEKISTGRYKCYYKLATGEAVGQFLFLFDLYESAVALGWIRTCLVAEEEPGTATLADSNANKTIIAKALKDQDVSLVSEVTGSVYKDLDTNIDSVGTKVDTAQADLNILTGTDGVTFATLQPNYAPSKAGDAMTLTSPYDAAKTAASQTSVNTLASQVGVAGAGLTAIGDTRLANLDVAVSGRAAPGDQMALTPAASLALTAAVWGYTTRTLTSLGTLAADTATAVWAAGTRTLTSFGSLTSDVATAVWASGVRTLSSFGSLASDTATAVWSVGTRTLTSFGSLTSDTATAVWAAGTRTLTSLGTLAADTATAVWAATTRTLSAFGFNVTVGTNNDKAGYSLAADQSGVTIGTVNSLGTTAKSDVRTQVDNALAAAHLDKLIVITGSVVDVAPLATAFTTNLASSVNDFYNGLTLIFTSGALTGQAIPVNDYIGSTKKVLLSGSLSSAPANGDAFLIASLPTGATINGVATAVWAASASAVAITGTTGGLLAQAASGLAIAGSVVFEYTVTDQTNGHPIAQVECGFHTDEAMTNLVRSGTTDTFGKVRLSLDRGTYYIRRYRPGYDFVDPDIEVVT